MSPRIARRPGGPAVRAVAMAHGLYFAGSGVWPLLHMPSFLAVTGPKHELWLVRTVGALIAVIGATVAAAAARDRVTPEVGALAAGSAAALGAIDVIYTARKRIPPVYLLDAAVEGALLAGWIVAARAGIRARAREERR